MFKLFKNKNKEIEGDIGYFNLADWWLDTFTKEERDHIEDVYKPMGIDPSTKPLTAGNKSYSTESAVKFLHILAGWFNNPKDRDIAKRIITKAEKVAKESTDVYILDKHFMLQQKMEIYYRERDSEAHALRKAISSCKDQIAIAPEAAQAFLEEYPEQLLPGHAGYRQLRIILERQGKFDEAISLCRKAKEQGWTDDWDKMIERLEKKKSK